MQNSLDKTHGGGIKTKTSSGKVNTSAKVVIVGAGLAGLSAGQKLYKSGVKDIIILDGQDRIGGRVHTIDHSDYLLELGAQWLHGADENPLYSWCNSLQLLDDFEDGSLGYAGLYCDTKGNKINQELVKKFLDIMVDIKLSLSKNVYSEVIKQLNFKNAGELFKYQLDQKMEQFKPCEKPILKSLFEWFMRFESIENCCDSMEHVSITSYTDYTDFSDGALLNFKHGYRSLLEWFCEQMPTEQIIHLSHKVTKIELNNIGSPVKVSHQNLDGIEGVINCNHVIVTSSLGFLKKHAEGLFSPPLPKFKLDLINSIGFGTVNKIILQFESRFWDKDYGIKLVWGEDKDSKEFPSWTKDIISFDSVRKQPNLLIGWIGGLGAKGMEQHSDEEVGQVCLKILDKFLPSGYNKPSKLMSCLCSRWHSNPFTLGSYSFQSMESFDMNVVRLQEPICNQNSSIPRILFGGEATAGNLYSTAHGAVISGWREANRLKRVVSIQSNCCSIDDPLCCSKLSEDMKQINNLRCSRNKAC